MAERPAVSVERPAQKGSKRREILLRAKQMLPFKGTLDFLAARLPGGKNAFMDLLRLAVELEAGLEPIAQAWEDTPLRERGKLSIDELCETAAPGIGLARISGLVMQAAMTWGLNTGNMVAALHHPRVVEASVKRALQKDGTQDRRMQFQHSGFLPHFGPVFNVSASANAEAEAQAAMAVKVEAPGLPPFELETVERAKVIRETSDGENDAVEGPVSELPGDGGV